MLEVWVTLCHVHAGKMGAVPGVLVLPPHMEQALIFLLQLGVIDCVSGEVANATRLLHRCLVLPMMLGSGLQLLTS